MTDEKPTLARRPSLRQLDKIEHAQKRLEEIERTYKLERAAARSELSASARCLSEIESAPERLAAVAWANENTSAPKADLAWAIFGREKSQYHLRKLLAGQYRNCQRCGARALAGHQFESHIFYCKPCASAVYASQQQKHEERERKSALRQLERQRRLSELKERAKLGDREANEIAALIVAQVDGPASQLANFLDENLRRQ